jgi:pimeloyl-ACP methyl ester carboxylesterase
MRSGNKSRSTKPAQTIRSQYANLNGTRLHYLPAGEGDPVALLHGYAPTSHMWRPLIAQLAATRTMEEAPRQVIPKLAEFLNH